MSRTVSVPGDAINVAYAPYCECEPDDYCECYEDAIANLRAAGKAQWPSMKTVDRWGGRENHLILENGYACLGISVYGSLASIWMCGKIGLGWSWTERQKDAFNTLVENTFGVRYKKIATASNGEAFYEKVIH